MYVVTVAPIKRGIPIDELSYFTKDPIAKGTLVSVPLRGASCSAMVIRSLPAAEAKSELKQSEFTLKKLERVRAHNFFSPAFVEAAEATANYYAASTGAVIQAVFPSTIIAAKQVLASAIPIQKRMNIGQQFILQAEDAERIATYKSHIREVFARGASCYFVLPSVQDIEHTYARIEKGIQNYTFILHSGLTKKEIEKRWGEILAIKHPVLIIGTPLYLAIPRPDIESIIIDKESSASYNLQSRPYIDLRFFAEQFARASGADLILGDLFLRVETLYRKELGEFEALMRPKSRIPSTAVPKIVDMRASGEQPATGKVAICSAELVDLIEETRERGSHIFILGVRRGFAPMTVCGDCGTVVACDNCSAPVVLHRRTAAPIVNSEPAVGEKSPNIFLCHRCGVEKDTNLTCRHCGGWRLVPLGIGVVQAEESIRSRFPDANIFRIDRDVIEKHSEAKKVIEKFYQTPGAILIGTEMALPYLTEPIASVAVLSVNSLLTMPDFRIGERVFRLLLTLREKATEHFLIQTRDPDLPLFSLASQGNMGEFFRSELEARKRLLYPPYSTLIKFTHEGGKLEGKQQMEEIEKLFGLYHAVSFPGFIAKVKGKYIMNALIKIPREGEAAKKAWPNDELFSLIKSLPPDITVRVDPDSVI